MVERDLSASPAAPRAVPADDTTQVVLDDHERFRRDFARLDDLQARRFVPATELALSDFLRDAAVGLRVSLGRRFHQFKTGHRGALGLDISDRHPEGYVRAELARAVAERAQPGADLSLGIGSLEER